jgi:iron complex outermembrane receptor protein
MREHNIGSMTAALALLGWSANIYAQSDSAASVGGATSGSPSRDTLAEVIVTAQRRAEPLQTVPVAVTSISEDQLKQAGIQDLSRLAVLTPGLFVGQGGADSEPAMRGVRTVNSREAQADAAIAFFVDGVYQSSNQQAFAGFIDVSRVEVDRGPQGTLYGRNSFGGNINVFSNLPTHEFGGSVSALAGDFGEHGFQSVLNLPLVDTLAIRIAGMTNDSSGYIKNAGTGGNLGDDDQRFFRVSALWTPSDRLTVIARTNYWAQDGHGDSSLEYKVSGTLVNPRQPYNADGTLNETIYGVPIGLNPRVTSSTGIPALAGYPAGVPVVPGPWTIDTNSEALEHLLQHATSLEVDYDVNFAVLKSISSYNSFSVFRSGDSDFTQYNVEKASQESPNETTTQELQLASKQTHPFQWIAGLYYLHTLASEIYQQYKFTIPGYTGNTNSIYNTLSYAGYAQGSYDLTTALRLTAGIRYTEDQKTAGGYDFLGNAPIVGGTKDFFRTTYHASLDYKLSGDAFLYASYSTGFRSGGYNAGLPASIPATFAPESVTAYEVGAKTRWLNDKLQVNVSAFDNRYSSLQIVGFDESTTLTYTENGGSADAKGVEVEVDAVPVPHLNVIGNVAYLDAKWKQLQTVNPITYSGLFNGDGNQLAQSPENRVSLAVDYEFLLGPAGSITPRVSERYSSSFYLTDFNTPLDLQKAYTQTDLRLSWHNVANNLSIEGFVTNLGNTAIKSSGEFGGYGAYFVSYLPPKQFGGQVTYKF